MIRILKADQALGLEPRETIPSQFFPAWNHILKHPGNEGYWAVLEVAGTVKEQLSVYVLRRAMGNFMVSMPYASFGSCLSRNSLPWLSELWPALERFAADHRCLSLSISTHPLSDITFEEYSALFPGAFSFHNFVQISVLDAHPLQKLKAKRRDAFRNELSKLEHAPGIRLEKQPTEQMFREWLTIYNGRYAEIGATPYPEWFLQNLYSASRTDGLIDFWLLRSEAETLGGVFFARGKNIADYFSSAFKSSWNKFYPTTFLLNQYFNHLLSLGIRYFNWQSSPRRGEGVYEYKRRWGAGEREHFYFSKNLAPLEEITRIPLSEIKRECAGCYILPFSLWGEPAKK